jgi:hypothetical protein
MAGPIRRGDNKKPPAGAEGFTGGSHHRGVAGEVQGMMGAALVGVGLGLVGTTGLDVGSGLD